MLLVVLGCSGSDEPARPTNAVLVSVDTLRADHLGVYGGPVPTPHADALAAEGVVVEHAFTPVPSTGPAMVSLLSGTHPWHHQTLMNAMSPPRADLPNLPEELQRAGFATGAFVSSYVVSARFGFGRGFDRHHFEPTLGAGKGVAGSPETWSSLAEPVTTAALAWLDSSVSEPFFLWVHYIDPHDPYKPPAGFERPEDEPVDVTNKRLPTKVQSFDQLRMLIRDYRGSVVYTDAQLGRLVAGLRERALLDRTAIVLTADHGEGLGDHGWLGHGQNLHNELVHVPLIVRSPGVAPGRRLDGAAQLEDIMPTLLTLLGRPVPEGVDGMDITPWLRGQVAQSPREVVVGRRAVFDDGPALFYALRGSRKWIGHLDGNGLVYRLDRDPKELAALRSKRLPEVLREQAEDLRNDGTRGALDQEAHDALKALGYLD
jgi:arylsulfatase A-like enzyme